MSSKTSESVTHAVLTSFPRNKKGDVLRVSLTEWNGAMRIDCRLFYVNSAGALGPTPKGCSVKLDEVEAFISALREGLRKAAEIELLTAEKKAA